MVNASVSQSIRQSVRQNDIGRTKLLNIQKFITLMKILPPEFINFLEPNASWIPCDRICDLLQK